MFHRLRNSCLPMAAPKLVPGGESAGAEMIVASRCQVLLRFPCRRWCS